MLDPSQLGLTSEAAVLAEATAIATEHFGAEPVSTVLCAQQGESSCTVEVGMKDGSHFVVQLRSGPVDEKSALEAHEILGDLVPVPTRVIRGGSPVPYAYVMPRIPGETWATKDDRGWSRKCHIKVAGQIGDIIGKCCSQKSSTESNIVDEFIGRRLQLYLKWGEPAVEPYKKLIKTLLERLDDLRRLPLCLTHWDINMMNIMVTDAGNVTGILDWQAAYWTPFGMNTCRISELAAYNFQGVLTKRSYSDKMEKAFWRGLFKAAPKEVRMMVSEIQLAKDIGLLMSTFHDASGTPHPSQVAILNKSMDIYRVPEDLSVLVCAPL